jgi:rubrerythrin
MFRLLSCHAPRRVVPASTSVSLYGPRWCSVAAPDVVAHPRSLLAKFPKVAVDYSAANATPVHQMAADSAALVQWTCATCQHDWRQSMIERTRCKTPCQRCDERLRPRVAAVSPRILQELHPTKNDPFMKPLDLLVSDTKPVWWLCGTCRHEYEMKISHRFKKANPRKALAERTVTVTARTDRCPGCAAAKEGPVVHQRLVDEWHPTRNGELSREEALRSTNRVRREVWWICSDCATEWKGTPQARRRGLSNCPLC